MANATAKEKTKIPAVQYKALEALISKGGLDKQVATVDMDLGALSALRAAGGIIEVGEERKQGRGTTILSAKVLKPLDAFESGPTRTRTGAPKTKGATRKQGVVTIEALERFVVDFKAALKSQATESAKSADSEVTMARTAVANAKTDDDLQNATAMLTAAINAKRDGSKRAVQATVTAMLKDDAVVTLAPVLKLMKEQAG